MNSLTDELFNALVECEAILSQMQEHMPLEGEAQAIMAQGYTGSAIVNARRAIAKMVTRGTRNGVRTQQLTRWSIEEQSRPGAPKPSTVGNQASEGQSSVD
jgi:hypothetical protein